MTCFTIFRRVTGPIGGAWTPYTAAQVAARRAAQIVAVVVCTSVPIHPPLNQPCDCVPVAPRPMWSGVELVPAAAWPAPAVQHVPEPASALVFAVAVAGLWRARR